MLHCEQIFYLIHSTLGISEGRVESIQKTLSRDASPRSSQPHLPAEYGVGGLIPYGTAHMGCLGGSRVGVRAMLPLLP